MTLCGGKRQLQPTSVAAIVPTRSVLMQIPHQELSPARISCGDLNFALVLYLLRKSVKCILSARLFSKVHEDSKKLECRELAQHASSKSIFNPEVDTQTGTTPTRIAGW